MIWAIKNKSITSTFVDAGAAAFFLPHLNEEKGEEEKMSKRLKYTIDGKIQSLLLMSAMQGRHQKT